MRPHATDIVYPINICIVASGDWRSPSRVNCHEIAGRWTEYGEVDYLEPAPMRAARMRDARRVVSRLLQRRESATADGPVIRPDRLHVHPAWYVPWHPTRAVRRVNARLAAWQLGGGLRVRKATPWDVLWFFSPALAGLDRLLPARVTVYHAVDDYAANPDTNSAAIESAERELLSRADLVFASSGPLAERLGAHCANVSLWENVADTEVLHPLNVPAAGRRPTAGFVGNLAPHKVDFALLEDVARATPDWAFVIAGPATGLTAAGRRFLDLPNVRYVGPLPRSRLPAVFEEVDVGLLPVPGTQLQESSFPMKVAEYFAMGLPVVGPVSRALEPVRKLVLPARTVGEFREQLERGYRLRRDRAFVQRLVEEAERRSWRVRMPALRAAIDRVLVSLAGQEPLGGRSV